MSSNARSLREVPRHELIAAALDLGIERPDRLSLEELQQKLGEAATSGHAGGRGWFSVAKHLVASVVEQGLNLPEAARVIRATVRPPPKQKPPLPTVTLAQIYLAQRCDDRARRVLEQVLAREPHNYKARELLERLNAGAVSDGASRRSAQGAAIGERTSQASGDSKRRSNGSERSPNGSAAAAGASEPRAASSPATAVAVSERAVAAHQPAATACEPGSMEPGGMEPGGMEPGSMEPGSMEPGSMEPGSMEPGSMERSDRSSSESAARGSSAEREPVSLSRIARSSAPPPSEMPAAGVARLAHGGARDALLLLRSADGCQLHVYWELSEQTAAHQAEQPVRVQLALVTPSWDGATEREWSQPISSQHGMQRLAVGASTVVRGALIQQGAPSRVLAVASNRRLPAPAAVEPSFDADEARSPSLSDSRPEGALATRFGGKPLVQEFRPRQRCVDEDVVDRALALLAASPPASAVGDRRVSA